MTNILKVISMLNHIISAGISLEMTLISIFNIIIIERFIEFNII